MGNYLRNSILATLIYYDIINLALTPLDVFNYLINPFRLSLGNKPIKDFSLHDIWSELENLVKLKIIGHKNGYYFLNGRDELFELRIERMKIADQKWMKFLKAAKWIQLVPYARGIFASGSSLCASKPAEIINNCGWNVCSAGRMRLRKASRYSFSPLPGFIGQLSVKPSPFPLPVSFIVPVPGQSGY